MEKRNNLPQKNALVPVENNGHVDQESDASSDEQDMLESSRDRSNAMVFDRSLVGGADFIFSNF